MKNYFPLICFLMFVSCKESSDQAEMKMNSFDSVKEITLIPYDGKTYVSWVIEAKGYIDDTIKIKREGYYDINLRGEIDTLINGDYYGQQIINYTVDPYKAKSGSLIIKFSL